MQRQEHGSIVIGCDFCGTDWDQIKPMIEGHRGSVICLECVKIALVLAAPVTDEFTCTMCQSQKDSATAAWQHPDQPDGANAEALICKSCISQAAGALSHDPDVAWKRGE